ncbi:DUF4433 domain-containing protein [Mesorhizobium sp. M1050]|uniref:DarT ssDNA thymidine ADP-ribosyltransferase family protein n=1 Tax=Mesorhizobium sp. M1050 TaxID=2957051 RepID=UPI0033386CB2
MTWEANLDRPYYSFRKKWPSRLFHHAPLENAVDILRDGCLRSRQDPKNTKRRDVAGVGVIDARTHAHNSARLYFRPRTPTQYHIEGIRKSNECNYGPGAHAPLLFMMVFDARAVLSQEGVMVSDRNMQLGDACPSDQDAYFEAIPFGKVYHEGGIGGDRTIIAHRCAEILVPSPLILDGSLQWVYCRSVAERSTLLHLLGPTAKNWLSRIIVSDDLLVFLRDFVFVEDVTIGPEGLVFQLNPRRDLAEVDVQITAQNSKGVVLVNFGNKAMKARPAGAKRWRIEAKFPSGTYHVQVRLEQHLAFDALINFGTGLI